MLSKEEVLKKTEDSKPVFDLVTTARFACYLPLLVLALGQITAYLDRQTKNQHPSGLYYFSLTTWDVAMVALPVVGIFWGLVAWRRTAGKLAILINILYICSDLLSPRTHWFLNRRGLVAVKQ
jgi:hypothetical protein